MYPLVKSAVEDCEIAGIFQDKAIVRGGFINDEKVLPERLFLRDFVVLVNLP